MYDPSFYPMSDPIEPWIEMLACDAGVPTKWLNRAIKSGRVNPDDDPVLIGVIFDEDERS